MDLSDRTALVTGSSRNIGRATAVALAEAGADVGVTARRDREACEGTAARVREAGGDAAVATGDLGDPDDVLAVVETVRDRLGPVDVLVNNAAIRPQRDFASVGREDLDRVTAVNFHGPYLLTQAVLPDMVDRGHGSVINVLGAFVYLGMSGRSHSFAAKCGSSPRSAAPRGSGSTASPRAPSTR